MDKRTGLFIKQLGTFTKCINQVSNVVKKKQSYNHSPLSSALIAKMEHLLPLMEQVYEMSYLKEVKGEKVENDKKLFSIYELHTDIIVKGLRHVQFGHRVNFSTGSSNLILTCDIWSGSINDKSIFIPTLDKFTSVYGVVPRDCSADGGYLSTSNMDYAKGLGIKNIVFGKLVGNMKNITQSKHLETRLKKWRAGIEAVISNLKRRFSLFRCNWKGKSHFDQKVLWSVIAYNIRVLTARTIEKVLS